MIIGIAGAICSGKDTLGKLIVDASRKEIHGFHHPVENPEETIDDGVVGYKYDYQIKKYAYKLKEVAGLLLGVEPWKFEEQEYKKSILGPEWSTKYQYPFSAGGGEPTIINENMTVREFLLKLGTDAIRDGLHANTWVNALMADYKAYSRSISPQEATSRGYIPSLHGNMYEQVLPNWVVTDVRFPNEYQAIKDRGGIVVHINRLTNPFQKVDHISETALSGFKFDYYAINNSMDDLNYHANLILKQARDYETTSGG